MILVERPHIRTDDPTDIVNRIIDYTGGDIRLALPLGLGKPVTILNALTQAAVDDPSVSLSIFTALTLERPVPSSDMERCFLEPAMDRLFGRYPKIGYARMLHEGSLPPNITVNEFFFLAGRWLGVDAAQQSYISANYTHARDVLVGQSPNVMMQLLAKDKGRFSLSSNTDISADLLRFRAEGRMDFLFVGEVSNELPFMPGAAEVATGEVALVLEGHPQFELFSAVRQPVSEVDHAIGLHVAPLVPDGGTLQVGIGSIGDAVSHALLLRHRGKIAPLIDDSPFPAQGDETAPFTQGLYAATEMLVGGLLALFEEGVIRREVNGAVIHAGFFVETTDFYRRLRKMPAERRAKIQMMPVSFTNALYGDEDAKRAARVGARFVNGAMKAGILGDVMSDMVKDGQVVSGVGGQFDFVSQAFALEGARSVITLPATRMSGGKAESNILWHLPAVTVPRHMRDIVVTEYGIADLRGQPDAEVVARMIAIADSRFQEELLDQAKSAGKIPANYEIRAAHRRNSPHTLSGWLRPHRDLLPDFPLGTDFDDIERQLLPALAILKDNSQSWQGRLRLFWSSLALPRHDREGEAMKRMGYTAAPYLGEELEARALRGALRMIAGKTSGN